MARTSDTPMSVFEHLERARAERPMHACLLDENGTWTYDALGRDAERFAGVLTGAGVGRQARVAILLNNSPAFALSYLAVAQTGAIPVPLDPMASEHTLRLILADCSPCAIVCETETAARLAALSPIHSVRAFFINGGFRESSSMRPASAVLSWLIRVIPANAAKRSSTVHCTPVFAE